MTTSYNKLLHCIILAKFEQPKKHGANEESKNYKRLRSHHYFNDNSLINCDSFSLKKLIPVFSPTVSINRPK